jgi:hypothetical protein
VNMGIWDKVKSAADDMAEKAIDLANEKYSSNVSKDILDDREIAQEAITGEPSVKGPSGIVRKGLSAAASVFIKSSKTILETVVSKYQVAPPVHDILDQASIEYIIKTLSTDKNVPINHLIDLACNNPDTLGIAFKMDDKRRLNLDQEIKALEIKHKREPDSNTYKQSLKDLKRTRKNYLDSEISLKLNLLRLISENPIPKYDKIKSILDTLNDEYYDWRNVLIIDFLLQNYLDHFEDGAKVLYAQKGLSIKPIDKRYLNIMDKFYTSDISGLITQIENI